jgi:hypothetical protein
VTALRAWCASIAERRWVRDCEEFCRASRHIADAVAFAWRNLQSFVTTQDVIAAQHGNLQLSLEHKEELPGFAVKMLFFGRARRHALMKDRKIAAAQQFPGLAASAPKPSGNIRLASHWLIPPKIEHL